MTFAQLHALALAAAGPRTLSRFAECGVVGAALEAASGAVYTGVNIDTACGTGFCAEAAAAAAMLTAGEHRVMRMIAVGSGGNILPPCGRCREFISQLHEDNRRAEVMVAPDVALTLAELLPYDWREASTVTDFFGKG